MRFMFSCKSNTYMYPPVTFNTNTITKCLYQKHLGVILDFKLDFNIHIERKIKRYNKIIEHVKDFQFLSQKKLYVPFINLLSGLISTMFVFCMINQTIKILNINFKRFSAKLVL